MNTVRLGQSDLLVTPICLGTMTFGEQVNEADSHAILSQSLARCVNFIDTAEMYAVPARAETFGATETIIGNWFARNPGARQTLVVATKVAGPSRGMPWVREGKGMTAADIVASCEGSLRRLQTDVIDLYQIHWPERHVPAFGNLYYDPAKETSATPIHEQLDTLAGLVKAGKVRAIGVSNFHPDRLMDIIGFNDVVPAVNQIEVNPFHQQEESVAFMRENGVQAEAWAPFAEGRNNLFQNEALVDIGRKHGRSVGQVVLRWVVQRGIVALAKSVRKERMEENLRVLDFALDEADMARISQLETGESSFFSHRDPAIVKWMAERRLEI